MATTTLSVVTPLMVVVRAVVVRTLVGAPVTVDRTHAAVLEVPTLVLVLFGKHNVLGV